MNEDASSKNNIGESAPQVPFVPLLKNGPMGTPVRDPLFAARILEQEKMPFAPSAPPATRVIPTQKASETEVSASKIIRTYQSDVAKALKGGKTSLVQMVIAEQRKREGETEETSAKNPRNLFFIIGSIVLLLVGLGIAAAGFFYLLGTKEKSTVETLRLRPASFIFTEAFKELDVTRQSSERVTRNVAEEVHTLNITLDFIEDVYFTEETVLVTPNGQQAIKSLLSTQKFFDVIESRMPALLSRALNETFLFGIHSFNGNQPFIILKTNFYENAFAGMLGWEEFLARDILPLFGKTSSDEVARKKFEDRVIKNRDLRVLVNSSGEMVLFYTFVDRSTIVITERIETLDEVVARLNRPNR